VNHVRRARGILTRIIRVQSEFPKAAGAGKRLRERRVQRRKSTSVVLDTGGRTLEQLGAFPIRAELPAQIEAGDQTSPEPAGELFDGNISRLGRVERDLPLDGRP
jgi:hypothetical protein